MAWIEQRRRADGGLTARVIWRVGGGRDAVRASETSILFSSSAADDFVFTSRTGLPLHNGDFYTHVWRKLMTTVAAEGLAPFRFHDLRHTHVAWLIAGGAPLPHIQARLGHESITTTIDTYGHLLPAGDELISRIIDTALTGGTIRPTSTP